MRVTLDFDKLIEKLCSGEKIVVSEVMKPTPTPTPTPSPTPRPLPPTDDSATPLLWAGLILTGLLGLAVSIRGRKSTQKKK